MTLYRNQSGIILRGGVSTGDVFDNCEDVLLVGRNYAGAGSLPNSYGLSLKNCRNVRMFDCDFADFARGIVAYLTTGFNISGNRFTGQKIDGINVAQSWRGVVADNSFSDPNTGEAHPDAIQLWSRPDHPPTSDIVIARNHVKGLLTQGITAFNHVRPQPVGFRLWTGETLTAARDVDDGGFDRINIADNDIQVGMPMGLCLDASRGSVVRDNRVSTLPGAAHRASINTDAPRSGNTVAAYLKWPSDNDPT